MLRPRNSSRLFARWRAGKTERPQFFSMTRPTTLPARSASIHFWTSPIGSSRIGGGLIFPAARQHHQLTGLGQRPDHEALDRHALVDPLHRGQAEIAAHQSGDDDLAAACDDRNRKRHRFLIAGEVDDVVETALGLLEDTLDDIWLRGVVSDGRAVPQARFRARPD